MGCVLENIRELLLILFDMIMIFWLRKKMEKQREVFRGEREGRGRGGEGGGGKEKRNMKQI